MADKKAKLREQVQRKNQEMIKQMNEAKAVKEEQQRKEKEQKQQELQVEKVVPGAEFFERLQKSKKEK